MFHDTANDCKPFVEYAITGLLLQFVILTENNLIMYFFFNVL